MFFKQKPVMLWIDHSLGGGTETYSKNQFKMLRRKNHIFRMQYFPSIQKYRITDINANKVYTLDSVAQAYNVCRNLSPREIVVNNLVGYQSAPNMLDFTKQLKQECGALVSFRGHDFHCVCPSYNLINCDGKYCNMHCAHGCETCWNKKRLAESDDAHNILKSGATSVQRWRNAWGDFLENTVDNIIVFSSSTSEIITRAHPNIYNKITITPHTVCKYPRVKIKPHDGINIAVLGNISHQKGASVIHEMSSELLQCADVKIIIIGKMPNAKDNIYVHGRYKPRELPKIMKKYFIDLVFIPSVWPETFSYTTSEAISMGLPVACYDIGAPAERVSKYDRGLVLKKIAPSENLQEIIKFILHLRKNKK